MCILSEIQSFSGYDKLEEHRCKSRCFACKFVGVCPQNNPKDCNDCSRRFMSQECYENHLIRPESVKATKNGKRRKVLGRSICMRLKKCRMCERTVLANKLAPVYHHWGERYCRTCKKWEPIKKWDSDKRQLVRVVHQCYMQPLRISDDQEEGRAGVSNAEIQDDPDDIDAMIRREENAQGETEQSRRQHFK